MAKLTDKQRMFCKEYLIDLNATQAAIRAGYSHKTAQEQGSRLLTNVMVTEYIQKLMDKRTNKVELTAENILKDIIETRKAAASDEKHNDRLKANELLGKHLKMWTDKVDLNGKIEHSFLDMIED